VLRSLLISLLTLLAVAPAASASPSMDVGIADDRVLLHGSDADAGAAVAEWRSLGVDVVRIHARWVAHVPEPNSATRPAAFDQSDPNSPGYNWGALDRAVGLVRGAGMRVLLTVTGSGPVWASLEPGVGSQRWKPSPASFAQFATAVARRYGREVDEYAIWNEPNHELWLQPQNRYSGGRWQPYAPHLYRKLVRAADPALRAADPGARVMLGSLAPRGTSARSRNARLRPLAFLRAMGCVDSRYRRVRSGDCRGFLPASGYGFAYHPHGLKLSPGARSSHPDEAQMGDLPRLVSAIDRVTRADGLVSRHPSKRFPLWLDEYGYQTNPPDKVLGVSSSLQSTYLQQGAYMAWAHPRVRNLSQYVWRDEPLSAGSAGWQSGLRYADGRPKGALTTFRHPFWAVRRSSTTVRLWGQVRPGSRAIVRLQRRSGSGWVTLTSSATDLRGFFARDVRIRSRSTFRFTYADGTSSTRTV
jgi:hypothetical protein